MAHDLYRNVLVLLLALPAAAAAVVALLGPRRGTAIRWISFAASVATLALAAVLAVGLWRLERDAAAAEVGRAGNRPGRLADQARRGKIFSFGEHEATRFRAWAAHISRG